MIRSPPPGWSCIAAHLTCDSSVPKSGSGKLEAVAALAAGSAWSANYQEADRGCPMLTRPGSLRILLLKGSFSCLTNALTAAIPYDGEFRPALVANFFFSAVFFIPINESDIGFSPLGYYAGRSQAGS